MSVVPAASSAELKVAVVGAGLMGSFHARAARRAGGRVVGVAEPRADADFARAARAAGIPVFPDAATLLAAARPDVVHVATPTPTHAAIVREALRAGAHVVAEKPLARDAAETAALFDEAAAAGRRLVPTHQFPHQRGVRAARAHAARLGPLTAIEVVVCSAGAVGKDAAGLDAASAEALPHALALVHGFAPGGLDAVAWRAGRTAAGEWHAHGVAAGVGVRILVSQGSRPTECTLLLRGRRGSFHCDLFHGFGFAEDGAVSRSRKILRPFAISARRFVAAARGLAGRALRGESAYPGLDAFVAAVYAALRDGSEPPVGPAEALATARARDVIAAGCGK